VHLLVDIQDPGMTSIEIQEGIEDGSLEDEIISYVDKTWGDDLANQLRSGVLGLTCLDTKPQEKAEALEELSAVTPQDSNKIKSPIRKPQELRNEGDRQRNG